MTTVVVAHESYLISELERDAFRAIDASVVQMGNLETPEALKAARVADALMVTIQPVDAELIRSLERLPDHRASRHGLGCHRHSRGHRTRHLGHIGARLFHRRGLDPCDRPAAESGAAASKDVRLGQGGQVVRCAAAIEPAPRLQGQVLGLIGYGRIGRMAAAKARGLGLKSIVTTPSLRSTRRKIACRRSTWIPYWRAPISYRCTHR